MSYNTQLQTKNERIQSILDKVNALPEAITLPTLDNPGTSADLLAGKELIDGDGNKVTGTIETKTVDDISRGGCRVSIPSGYYAETAQYEIPSISIDPPIIRITDDGLITSTVEQGAGGFVESGTISSSNEQLTTQAATTITPTTSDQTAVASGTYTTGEITVAGDTDLVATNIKSGTSIFGVAGTFSDDANATASTILASNTAYVKGAKVTGTMTNNGAIASTMDGIDTKSVSIPAGYTTGGTVSLTDDIDNEVDTQADLISQIATALQGKAGGSGSDQSSIKSCSVQFITYGGTSIYAIYRSVVNGDVIWTEYRSDEALTEDTITDVLCGSTMVLYGDGLYGMSVVTTGDIIYGAMSEFSTIHTVVVNDTGTIDLVA